MSLINKNIFFIRAIRLLILIDYGTGSFNASFLDVCFKMILGGAGAYCIACSTDVTVLKNYRYLETKNWLISVIEVWRSMETLYYNYGVRQKIKNKIDQRALWSLSNRYRVRPVKCLSISMYGYEMDVIINDTRWFVVGGGRRFYPLSVHDESLGTDFVIV